MDRFGRACGLHCPGSTSAPSDKLLYRGYGARLAGCYYQLAMGADFRDECP